MHRSCQELAVAGCSWRKNRPPATCSLYSWHTNSKCTMALFHSRATTAGSRLDALSLCQLQKALHIGLPTKNIGFCCAMRLRASFRLDGSSKSQATPFSSVVVRSRARPGTMPNPGSIFAQAVTRGGLYTSVITCVAYAGMSPGDLTGTECIDIAVFISSMCR